MQLNNNERTNREEKKRNTSINFANNISIRRQEAIAEKYFFVITSFFLRSGWIIPRCTRVFRTLMCKISSNQKKKLTDACTSFIRNLVNHFTRWVCVLCLPTFLLPRSNSIGNAKMSWWFIWPTIHELHDYGRLQATSGNVSTRFIICAVINNEFLDGFSSLIKVIRSSTDIYPKC